MERYTCQCNDNRNDTLRHRKLGLFQVLVAIMIPLLVFLEDSIVYAVMRVHLEPNISMAKSAAERYRGLLGRSTREMLPEE